MVLILLLDIDVIIIVIDAFPTSDAVGKLLRIEAIDPQAGRLDVIPPVFQRSYASKSTNKPHCIDGHTVKQSTCYTVPVVYHASVPALDFSQCS
jgi:hypothetical protein